jgi:hypothetical protein
VSPGDRLDTAVAAYVTRFGAGPPVLQFLDQPEALERELRAAVERGEPVTAEGLARALGVALLDPAKGIVA